MMHRRRLLLLSTRTRPFQSHSTVCGRRKFATSSATGAKGARLAGRPRFYKEVDVVPVVETPWSAALTLSSSSSGSSSSSSSSAKKDDVIESPISAGVDGTQSATGVHHVPTTTTTTNNNNNNNNKNVDCQKDDTATRLKNMLMPRLPGSANEPTITTTTIGSDWYGVTLDGRKISTPMGQVLSVPSRTLAHMIAAEWDAQTVLLQPSSMPMMTLTCTALDQAALHPQVYRDEALQFLPTDTTCFWADPTEDRLLHRRQEQSWKSVHDYVEATLGDGCHKPSTALGMEGMLMARKRGPAKPYAGLPHPRPLVEAARNWTHALDAWQLVALSSMASQCKSWFMAYALLDAATTRTRTTTANKDGTLPPPFASMAEAVEASRVEEELQISIWGMVEGQHDYDRLNASIQLHSAHLFAKSILLDNHLLS